LVEDGSNCQYRNIGRTSASADIYGVLLRFVDGQLDQTFGGDGFANNFRSQFSAICEDSSGGSVALNWGGALLHFAADGRWEQDFVPDVLSGSIRDLAGDAAGRFVYPGQGRAIRLLPDGDGVLVGGYHFNVQTGTDVASLRIQP